MQLSNALRSASSAWGAEEESNAELTIHLLERSFHTSIRISQILLFKSHSVKQVAQGFISPASHAEKLGEGKNQLLSLAKKTQKQTVQL